MAKKGPKTKTPATAKRSARRNPKPLSDDDLLAPH